jgi:hypothetical protein
MKKAVKSKVGRKCSICTHKKVGQINKAIAEGVSFRNVVERFGLALGSVHRHTEKCLQLALAAVTEQKLVEQGIDVHKEFEEQLEFAKQLRIAAKEYLASPDDPLKLILTPRADEIEVVYYDHNDLFMGLPKKKKAQLSVLLESLSTEAGFEPDKYSIKHVDMRKFALDAIATADICIDKFAKLAGMYVDKSEKTINLNVTRVIEPDPLDAELIG